MHKIRILMSSDFAKYNKLYVLLIWSSIFRHLFYFQGLQARAVGSTFQGPYTRCQFHPHSTNNFYR